MNTETPRTMPALTLWQPWACLIEIGAKRYETRHFKIPARLLGECVAIHAAARPCFTEFDQETVEKITEAFGAFEWMRFLPRGAIVATAILAESIPVEKVAPDAFGDYSPGRWAWRLEDVREVVPHISAKGQQQIGWDWTIPEGFRL